MYHYLVVEVINAWRKPCNSVEDCCLVDSLMRKHLEVCKMFEGTN